MRLNSVCSLASVSTFLCSIVLTPFAIPALAQQSSAVLEEIIVNARRISESAQDVPVAITAFSEAEIDMMAPRTLRDFDGTVPNLFLGMNAASASGGAIFIRGIGYAGTEKTQSPGVGVILDGVQLGTNTGQLMDTFDIRRVEVNRGPQGVLFGKNTTGGTISIERIAPEFNRWGGAVSLTYGDYEEQTFKGRLNVPLLEDQLAMKLGYIKKERDGYWDNPNENCDECEGDIDYESFTGVVLWQPTDSFDLKFTYDYLDDDSDLPPMDPFFNGPTPFVTLADFEQRGTEYDLDAYTLEMNWETSIGVFTSITGYRDSTDIVYTDFDGASVNDTAVPIALFHTIRDQDFEQFSQELRLSGSFNDDWDFTAGVYYYESDLDFEQNSATQPQIPNPLPAGFGCALIGASAHPVVGDDMCQLPQTTDNHIAEEEVESLGVFGAVTWRPTDQLELGFGARYIDEEKEMFNAFFETTDPDNIITGSTLDDDDQWDDVIVKATASYRFNDQVMLYGSYGQGFLSGGYSIRSIRNEYATYQPENVDSYEIGLKTDLWDRRARINLTAFYTEQSDKQWLSIITDKPAEEGFPTTDTVVNNRPDTDIEGIEAEILVAVTDNLTISFIGGIQDGDEKGYIEEGNRLNGIDPGPYQMPDSDIAFFPGWNWAITPTYTTQVGPGILSASFTYKDQDEYIIGISSSAEDIYEDGYNRLDARVAYEWTLANAGQMILAVFGKNLTDEEYREHQLDLAPPDFGFQGWGAPRTWAVELQYRH